MAKIRVYELAKKMGVSANQLLEELQALGVEVKSNLSALDESVLQKLGGGAPAQPAKPSPARPKAASPSDPSHPAAKEVNPPAPRAKSSQATPAPKTAAPALPKPLAHSPAKAGAAQPSRPAPAAPPLRFGPAVLQKAGEHPSTKAAAAPPHGPEAALPERHVPPQPARPAPVSTHHTPTGYPARPAPNQPARPASASPQRSQPGSQFRPARPQAGHPQAANPQAAHPQAARPQAPHPQAARPQAPHPQAARPQAAHPQAARPQAPHPQAARPQAAHPQATHPQATHPQAAPPRPGPPHTARPAAPAGQRPQGGTSQRPAPYPPGRIVTHPLPPRPGSRPHPATGTPGQPAPRPQAQRPDAQRPPARPQPPTDFRRKTKRERRIEKIQAREDRRTKLQNELDQAKAKAATGEAVFIREGISVKELAEKINSKVKDVIAKLMMRGILATINQPLDAEVAVQLCSQFGFAAEIISYEDEMVLTQAEAPEEGKVHRSPVVTVMGHVDHGKSSLLEAIHDVDITSKEFGGITQHIGAYKVKKGEHEYVFLDTPGHEAFTLMRARGAQVTDIVILVVAADDGVMPQTVEAINHCKAANVPMVVAINKIDKPGANPDRVRQDLMAHGVVAEDFGGDVVTVNVSAKARQGIDELLEMIFIVSDMLQLKASPDQPGSGTILESRLDRARGPVATVLIQDGTLKVGDLFLCGATYGHVRGLFDDHGRRLESVGPSTPVEVLGFSEVPGVGAVFQVMEDEAKARQVASFRKEQEKQKSLRITKVRLDNVFGAIQQGELKELALIVKADVHGSLEALNGQIQNLPQDQIRTRVVHQGVGAISESDILLASASNALVIGFNVRPDKKALDVAKTEAVEVLTFTVIYDLVDQLKLALSGMLKPIEKEVLLGHAEVKEVFRIGKVGTVAGCIVTDGHVLRSAHTRVLRDNIVIHTGKFSSLKRFKDDVSEVKEGSECGIGLENFHDIKPADVIEAFEIQMEERKL